MCGLAGYLHYGKTEIKNLDVLTNALAREAAVRGTDATGIAFVEKGRLYIQKDGKPAYKMDFKHSGKVGAVTIHTRHTTCGKASRNRNNHPFCGRVGSAGNSQFMLEHNGVILNEAEIKTKYNLPKTDIETDSYVAVQLLEYTKKLDENSIKFMAENVEGSFSFSILDNKGTLWLVKGDSPLHILHFPDIKMYVYASTEEILWKALINTGLFEELKKGRFEVVPIHGGDILKISSDGKVTCSKFNYRDYSRNSFCNWRNYTFGNDEFEYSYVDDLKSVASYYGYSPDTVDEMVADGFSPYEIEEYMCAEYWGEI